ncbi:MAG TPA: sensor histidine kinase [Flavisolibacter sp.]|jgi:signal transduction histidine kinase|nr:sensor histidine kinase [Flavisolibacter sp.]
MRRIVSVVFLFCFLSSFSQNNDLRKAIEKETNHTKKTTLLLQQAFESRNADPQLSFISAQEAAKLIGNSDPKKLVDAQYLLALYYNKTEKFDSVLYYTQKNIHYLNLQNSRDLRLVDFNNLEGAYFMHLNKQRDALERYYASLKIADASADVLSKIKAVTNIGWAFMELNQCDTAVVYFRTAITLMRSNNLDTYAAAYNNLASCYGDLKKYDSAEKFVLIGIDIAKKNNDLIAEANGLNILGTVYEAKKQYAEELKVLTEAKAIREKLGDPFFMVSDMATIAGLYSKTGQYQKGIDISLQALNIAKKNNIVIKLPLIYQALAGNYEGAGNYNAAMNVYKQLSAMKDSMYADASPQALAEMRTQYETEKKERMIHEQQNKLVRQKIMIGTGVALFILVSLLGYTQYRRYQWKQEAKMKAAILKQQEEATKAVIEAEEGERQRIAKDLHDGVGQMMSAAKMNLSAFESNAQFKDEDEKQNFENIIALVDESCKEVRSVSHNMMPNALLKSSLASAIREFIDKLDQNKLRVHLYTEGLEDRLDSNVETVLYRVIQECVNNVIKHADANTLDISVIRERNEITATIEDNGKGFDTNNKEVFEGIGLINIRTRVEYLKGTVDFDSSPGKGTLVALHVPV